MDRAHRTETPGSRLRALRGLRDQRGLSTTEYVIILICIAVIGISAWRSFGSSARDRTARASGEVAGLEATPGQGSGARGGGGIRVARSSSSALDEATADATPPGEDEGGWMSPAFALGLAAVVILAVVARNFQKRGGGGDGGGGGGEGAAG